MFHPLVEELIMKDIADTTALDACVIMCGDNDDGESAAKELRELRKAAQQSMHLTALRRGLAVSIFINVVLLAMVLYFVGGK